MSPLEVKTTFQINSRYANTLARQVVPDAEVRKNCLIEMQLSKGSIVFGAFPFVGYLDDQNKTAYYFSDRPDVSHFNQAYHALVEDRGYELAPIQEMVRSVSYQGEALRTSKTGLGAMRVFLESRGILGEIDDVIAGQSSPLAGVTAIDINRVGFDSVSGVLTPIIADMNMKGQFELVSSGVSSQERIIPASVIDWVAARTPKFDKYAESAPRVIETSAKPMPELKLVG